MCAPTVPALAQVDRIVTMETLVPTTPAILARGASITPIAQVATMAMLAPRAMSVQVGPAWVQALRIVTMEIHVPMIHARRELAVFTRPIQQVATMVMHAHKAIPAQTEAVWVDPLFNARMEILAQMIAAIPEAVACFHTIATGAMTGTAAR